MYRKLFKSMTFWRQNHISFKWSILFPSISNFWYQTKITANLPSSQQPTATPDCPMGPICMERRCNNNTPLHGCYPSPPPSSLYPAFCNNLQVSLMAQCGRWMAAVWIHNSTMLLSLGYSPLSLFPLLPVMVHGCAIKNTRIIYPHRCHSSLPSTHLLGRVSLIPETSSWWQWVSGKMEMRMTLWLTGGRSSTSFPPNK